MSDHTVFLEGLRHAGYRLTPQREMVLSVLCESGGHMTADDILTSVRARYPYLNKSVVYRTLDLLVRVSLVNQADFGSGRIEYEIHQHPHHHHLLCRKCGKRIEVEESLFAPLAKALHERYDFVADLDHFAIFGTCRKCQKAKPARRAPQPAPI